MSVRDEKLRHRRIRDIAAHGLSGLPEIMKRVCITTSLVLLSGCAHTTAGNSAVCASEWHVPKAFPEQVPAARVKQLKHELMALGSNVDAREAQQVADRLVRASLALRSEYEVDTLPVVHNLLINLGEKKRGLCVHWVRDLLTQLQQLDLKTFDVFWGIAHAGNPLREHSTVVMSARGEPFEKGLVLDSWRYTGCLYSVLVKDDKYPWQQAYQYRNLPQPQSRALKIDIEENGNIVDLF